MTSKCPAGPSNEHGDASPSAATFPTPPPRSCADDPWEATAQETLRRNRERKAQNQRNRRARISSEKKAAENAKSRASMAARRIALETFTTDMGAELAAVKRQAMEADKAKDRSRKQEERSKQSAAEFKEQREMATAARSALRAKEDEAQRATRLETLQKRNRASKAAQDEDDRDHARVKDAERKRLARAEDLRRLDEGGYDSDTSESSDEGIALCFESTAKYRARSERQRRKSTSDSRSRRAPRKPYKPGVERAGKAAATGNPNRVQTGPVTYLSDEDLYCKNAPLPHEYRGTIRRKGNFPGARLGAPKAARNQNCWRFTWKWT